VAEDGDAGPDGADCGAAERVSVDIAPIDQWSAFEWVYFLVYFSSGVVLQNHSVYREGVEVLEDVLGKTGRGVMENERDFLISWGPL
jgi:hypothetical protein